MRSKSFKIFLLTLFSYLGLVLNLALAESKVFSTPAYCKQQVQEYINPSCVLKKEEKQLSEIKSLNNYLVKDNFQKSLYRYSMAKLLVLKQQTLKVFPEFSAKWIDYDNWKQIKPPFYKPSNYREIEVKDRLGLRTGEKNFSISKDHGGNESLRACLKDDPIIKSIADGLDSNLAKERELLRSNSNSNKDEQIKFLADRLLNAINATELWEHKVSADTKINYLEKRKRNIKKQIDSRINSKIYLHGDVSKVLEHDIKKLKDINIQLHSYKQASKELDKVVLNDPLMTDYTNTINPFKEKSFKKSNFLEGAITALKKVGDSQDYYNFIKNLAIGVNKGQAIGRLEILLENSPDFYKKIYDLAQSQVAKQLDYLDKSIVEICKTQGGSLHHYQSLVDEAKEKLPHNDYSVKKFEESHCSLLKSSPLPKPKSYIGVMGAGLLITAGSAAIGGLPALGLSLTGAGSVLTGIQLHETFKSQRRYNIGRGLSEADLAKRERVRKDFESLKKSQFYSTLSLALLPLDLAIAPKMLNGLKQVAAKNTRSSKRIRNLKEGISVNVVKDPKDYRDYEKLARKRLPKYGLKSSGKDIDKDYFDFSNHILIKSTDSAGKTTGFYRFMLDFDFTKFQGIYKPFKNKWKDKTVMEVSGFFKDISQKQHIASFSKMNDEMIKTAKAKGMDGIYIEVPPEHIKNYERWGFKRIGENFQPSGWDGDWAPLLLDLSNKTNRSSGNISKALYKSISDHQVVSNSRLTETRSYLTRLFSNQLDKTDSVTWSSKFLSNKKVIDSNEARKISDSVFENKELQDEIANVIKDMGGPQSSKLWDAYFLRAYNSVAASSDGYIRAVTASIDELPKKGNIIDFGSGPGNFIFAAAKESKGRNFIGLDLSPHAVDKATKSAKEFLPEANIQFRVENLTKLSDDLPRANGGIMNNVLYNFASRDEKVAVLKSIKSKLKKGAILVLNDPLPILQKSPDTLKKWLGGLAESSTKNGSPLTELDIAFLSEVNRVQLAGNNIPFSTTEELIEIAKDAGFELVKEPRIAYDGVISSLVLRVP